MNHRIEKLSALLSATEIQLNVQKTNEISIQRENSINIESESSCLSNIKVNPSLIPNSNRFKCETCSKTFMGPTQLNFLGNRFDIVLSHHYYCLNTFVT